MWPNPQFPADLVKFTEEILKFLRSGLYPFSMNALFNRFYENFLFLYPLKILSRGIELEKPR